MTKKLYFDCPLIAGYMAKEFGVKYCHKWFGKSKMTPIVDYCHMSNLQYTVLYEERNKESDFNPKWKGCSVQVNSNERIYIAPESLDIFELRQHDLVTNTHDYHNAKFRPCSGRVMAVINGGRDVYIQVSERRNGKSHFCEEITSLIITMRNNKPFHMALEEE